jgi:hypothetical protein
MILLICDGSIARKVQLFLFIFMPPNSEHPFEQGTMTFLRGIIRGIAASIHDRRQCNGAVLFVFSRQLCYQPS